jgi:hypothetical protein
MAMIHDEVQGLIVWHFYRTGRLVNSKAEKFKGNIEELIEKTDANFEKVADTRIEKLVPIFHTFIPL